MSPEQLFSFTNIIASIGWLVLIFFPFWKNRYRYLVGTVILLLCIVYTWLIFSNLNIKELQNFSSLNGVMSLFTRKEMVTAGWVHYLAFDLLTGIFISNNAQKLHINHWLMVPVLFSTFMLGPFGLLLFLIMRWIVTKKYISENNEY